MPPIKSLLAVPSVLFAVLIAVLTPVAYGNDQRSGGASAPTRPVIAALACSSGQARCAPGETLTLQGNGLGEAQIITFLGRRGRRDDRRARPRLRADHLLTVRVPRHARSGTVRVSSSVAGSAESQTHVVILRATAGGASVQPPSDQLFAGGRPRAFRYAVQPGAENPITIEVSRITDGLVVASWPAQPDATGSGQVMWDGTTSGVPVPIGRYAFRMSGPAEAAAPSDATVAAAFDVFDAIFPIRGRHDLGRTPAHGFGGGRGHMGQDLLADCGTRLVAARGGIVTFAGFQARAGNYIVITGSDQQSYVYMHMRGPSALRTGQPVLTGQPVGEVGETGRASGCHLHFELWTAPGWRVGEATAVDPLPELARWDTFS